MLLTYSHVEVSYHARPVVKDVSFTLAPGEIVGIVGESGSGKSTIIKAALGLLGSGGMVTRGDIFYSGCETEDLAGSSTSQDSFTSVPARGIDVLALSPRQLRDLCGKEMAMVFQDCSASMTPIRTISYQVHESMSAHQKISCAEADARALDLLRKLNFDDPERILSSYPFELSGGMGQRVSIAIALLLKPKILLLDEPTSALDAFSQRQIVDKFLELRKEHNTAMVVITHNIGVVRAMADKIMVLKNGQVEEFGPAQQVLENSQSRYTRALISAVPRLEKTE